jgi:hypothetical protein
MLNEGKAMANVQDSVLAALAKYGDLSSDKADAAFGGGVYRSVADVVDASAPAGEECALAFPAMIIRPDIRDAAFVAVFRTVAIVAWRKGVFKKRTEHVKVRLNEVTSAQWHVSNRPSSRGATLLEISAGGETTTLGLPKGKPPTADLLRDAFLVSARP